MLVGEEADQQPQSAHRSVRKQIPAAQSQARADHRRSEADYASVGFKRDKGELDINVTARQLERLRVIGRRTPLPVTATLLNFTCSLPMCRFRAINFQPIRLLHQAGRQCTIWQLLLRRQQGRGSPSQVSLSFVHLDELQVLRKKDGRRLKLVTYVIYPPTQKNLRLNLG